MQECSLLAVTNIFSFGILIVHGRYAEFEKEPLLQYVIESDVYVFGDTNIEYKTWNVCEACI